MKTINYCLTLFCCALALNLTAQPMEDVIEIRSYNLKPGSRSQFQKLFDEQALPMLKKWKIEVVAYGSSLHDENSFFLARAFTSLANRQSTEDAFYGSPEWKNGPREAILNLIESYTTIVIPRTQLNKVNMNTEMDDLDQLSRLNAQFIKNYIAQDTTAHNEIIHEDFVCIENAGAIVSRKEYMKDWATSYKSSGFTSFKMEDEFIRLFGDMALVRAKTSWTRRVKGVVSSGVSVYTDTYKKENGRWWCVHAQITPIK
ncbi:MAG: DUF4440 domain-containing protein [Cyclobacteriaceae bacterium]|nr:DUF4440 domain-containing protein [Cyclobacteriaceae bacterium]